MPYLIDFLEQILGWLEEYLIEWPKKIFEAIVDGLVQVLEAIPVPEWLTGVEILGGLDPGIAYFAEALMLSEGLAIILGAYVLRFLIRRIPVIG